MRCLGITESTGMRCKNPSARGFSYCRHHNPAPINWQYGGANLSRLRTIYGNQLETKFTTDRTAPNNAEIALQEISDSDPSGGKYVEWIIQSYLRGGIKLYEDITSKIPKALKEWGYLKNKKILKKGENHWEDETNILNYCGLDRCTKNNYLLFGLYDVLNKYQDILNQQTSKIQNKITPADAEEVYNDDEIRIINPKTEKGACYYGQGTRWCTAAETKNAFKNYNEKGPLYIIIPKHPQYPGEKYQLHLETNSFMNEKDESVSWLFEYRFPSLVKFKPLAYVGLKTLVEHYLLPYRPLKKERIFNSIKDNLDSDYPEHLIEYIDLALKKYLSQYFSYDNEEDKANLTKTLVKLLDLIISELEPGYTIKCPQVCDILFVFHKSIFNKLLDHNLISAQDLKELEETDNPYQFSEM